MHRNWCSISRGQAREHQKLQRDYYRLLADIERKPGADAAQVANWKGDMVRIFGDEQPIFRAIDAKAYNDAIDTLGVIDGKQERLVIPWHHRVLGHVVSFEGYRYDKLSEASG